MRSRGTLVRARYLARPFGPRIQHLSLPASPAVRIFCFPRALPGAMSWVSWCAFLGERGLLSPKTFLPDPVLPPPSPLSLSCTSGEGRGFWWGGGRGRRPGVGRFLTWLSCSSSPRVLEGLIPSALIGIIFIVYFPYQWSQCVSPGTALLVSPNNFLEMYIQEPQPGLVDQKLGVRSAH